MKRDYCLNIPIIGNSKNHFLIEININKVRFSTALKVITVPNDGIIKYKVKDRAGKSLFTTMAMVQKWNIYSHIDY
jgi:hypothetical protein